MRIMAEFGSVSVTELGKCTAEALRELLHWVFIRAKTNREEKYTTYIGNLNALANQYNQSVERRLNGTINTNQELTDDIVVNEEE